MAVMGPVGLRRFAFRILMGFLSAVGMDRRLRLKYVILEVELGAWQIVRRQLLGISVQEVMRPIQIFVLGIVEMDSERVERFVMMEVLMME